MPHKLTIGDIVEISTAKGFAYAQYSHKHPTFGGLLRILPGFFAQRPNRFDELAAQRAMFVVFVPLQAMISRRIVTRVGFAQVPDREKSFPLFKVAGARDQKTRRVVEWWLWDGKREWRVGALEPGQEDLPTRGIWNDSLLVERLERGWSPRDEVVGELAHATGGPDQIRPAPIVEQSHLAHLLYFPSQEGARRAGQRLEKEGYSVEVRPAGDDTSWLTLAKQKLDSTQLPEQRREHLTSLASELGGEYDGWEIAVQER